VILFQKFRIKSNAKGFEKAIYIHDTNLNQQWIKFECISIINGDFCRRREGVCIKVSGFCLFLCLLYIVKI